MSPLAVIFVFFINSIIAETLPECECISKWSNDDIDCSSSTISTLESYLASDNMDCINSCDTNTLCQQSYSLLTQFYDACALGSVSQSIMRKYHLSSCTHCNTDNYYQNDDLQDCKDRNCTDSDFITAVTEIVGINCIIDALSDENETCSTECQADWDKISSYQRQCSPILPLDSLYDDADDETSCDKDCNRAVVSASTDCEDEAYDIYSKLDIKELEKAAKLCFYGLNIDDPTKYDLVCVNRANVNDSGILSYSTVSETVNDSFWSVFGIAHDMNLVWILLCASIVFFMQLGFTLLEAGSVKSSSVQNILFKNLMDSSICALCFWIAGYSVAYGDPNSSDANGFMGVENILIESETYGHWFFQMSFACTACTIVSGAVAERTRLEAYFIYTIIVSSWIYPVVTHWIWSQTGFLSPSNESPAIYGGAIDFAGSSSVHMIGGIIGLCGAYFVGPRFRRFDESEEAKNSKFSEELQHQFEFGSNVPFQVLGLFILWFGFYAFNPGSTLIAQGSMNLASKIAVNTTLSAAAGGLTSAFVARATTKSWHIPRLCNGLLAALASITASCAIASSGWAIFIGFVGSLLYYVTSHVMLSKHVQIDDPLDTFSVHAIPGAWGVLSAALFSTHDNLKAAGYPQALYAETTVGERFATNLLLVVLVFAWALANGAIVFGSMRYLGILRVTEDEERLGIDISKHGGAAVNLSTIYYKRQRSSRGQKKFEYQRTNASEDVDADHVRQEAAAEQLSNIQEIQD